MSGYNGVAGNTHHPQGSCSSTMASRKSSTVEALSVHAASTAGVLDCSPVFPAAPNTFCGSTADYRTGDGHSICLYFSAQQIEELEEQLETIRFLISDEMQHETVIHYLKPMKNYLESLRSSKIVPLIENLITGKDISIENAQHIEVLLDDYYENDEVIQDFITDLALYNPGGGEYLYSHSEITPKAKHILAYIQKNYCSDG